MSTTSKLAVAISKLSEGDKVKLLQLAEALLEQKQGKRAKRAARFRDDMDEGFRVYG